MQASPHLMLSRSVRVEIGVIRSINRTYACTTPRLLHVGVPILWYGVYTGPRPLRVGVGRPLGAWPAVGGTWVLADGLVSAAGAGWSRPSGRTRTPSGRWARTSTPTRCRRWCSAV